MAIPALLRTILPQALDADSFAVSEERPDPAFLSKTVMVVQNDGDSAHIPERRLASPMTKRTVAIVDRTTNLVHAAQALVEARFAFGGRSPYSPDVVFVHEFAMKFFVEAVIQHSSKYLAGQNGQARQFAPARPSRLSLLETAQKDPGARVLVSGSTWAVVEVNNRYARVHQVHSILLTRIGNLPCCGGRLTGRCWCCILLRAWMMLSISALRMLSDRLDRTWLTGAGMEP